MINKLTLIILLAISLSFASDTLQRPNIEYMEGFVPERKFVYWLGKVEKAVGLLAPFAILYDNLNKKECRGYHIAGYASCIGAVTLGEIHVNISRRKK